MLKRDRSVVLAGQRQPVDVLADVRVEGESAGLDATHNRCSRDGLRHGADPEQRFIRLYWLLGGDVREAVPLGHALFTAGDD
jgi:hypothetical protein